MKATDIPASLSLDEAVESMLSPELGDEEDTTEETLEDTSTEEDQDTDSEETDEEETSELEESDESQDTDDEYDEEDSEDESAELYTVTVDGEEQQVPLNELIRGYSGQQYVQKGMKQAAEARKSAEEAYDSLQSERRRVAQIVQFVESGQLTPPPAEPDKALFESDPIGYMEAKIRYDDELDQYKTRMASVRRVVEQQNHTDAQAFEAYRSEQEAQLRAVEPDFADPAKEAVIRRSMATIGENVYGYSKEEIDAVIDHRALRVLRDATRWQELQAKKPKAKQRVSRAVASKGRRKKATTADARKTKQRARLRQSGKIEDAVNLMFG